MSLSEKKEEDYFALQVFRSAVTWLEKNREASKFFLVVDSFDPHEPWDPPAYYRRMYAPDEEGVADMIFSPYGLANRGRIEANAGKLRR